MNRCCRGLTLRAAVLAILNSSSVAGTVFVPPPTWIQAKAVRGTVGGTSHKVFRRFNYLFLAF